MGAGDVSPGSLAQLDTVHGGCVSQHRSTGKDTADGGVAAEQAAAGALLFTD